MNQTRDRAAMAAARRTGCSPARAALITANFMAQHDLRSTCKTCGHPRKGTFAEVSSPCPKCEARRAAGQ